MVRKPVGDGDKPAARTDADEDGEHPQPGPPAAGPAAREPQPESPAERTGATPRPQAEEPAPQPREKATSDWFAPRKPPPAPPQSGGPGGPADQAAPAGPTPAGGAYPAGGVQEPAPYGAAAAQAGGFGGARDADPYGGGPRTGDLPQAEDAQGQRAAAPGMPYFSDGPDTPSGPTTGPALGTTPVPPVDPTPDPLGAGPLGPDPYGAGPLGAGPLGSAAPVGDPLAGPPHPGDDTALLAPQDPRPGPPPQVSGDTLTTGIPVIPQEPQARPGAPFPLSGPAQVTQDQQHHQGPPSGLGAYPPALDEPAPPAPRPTPVPETRAPQTPSAAPRKKGRSKLVVAAAGLFGLVGVAYGAGLLLNHSDVPKGTVVLGVDIGGGTKEEAVQKLDAALGPRATRPLEISVSGEQQSLAPDKAGLTLDTQATVRGAAGSDYNPVSVIGSLFGQERVAQPVIPVDEEKLAVALRDLAGGAGTVVEGTITFEPGKVTAVPGKPGKALDVQRSMISVRDAYRAQVETGRTNTVELPVASQEPTITQAELDRAMKEFAKPAMSDLITIRAGGKQIQFGPQRSLPQILSMKPIDGRLVEVYDKKAIDRLLDGVFDGIEITKGDGEKHQLSADDVASAMQKALLGKTPAERTVTIELDPQG
ncbi:hypothetical protein BJP40_02490 [Streptomyces sp. CC53]|nr:hypothetical protein BJP40_02490 [Streptomyces sp. CC53]